MNYDVVIMQQKASVDMLRAFVKCGRANAEELQHAERRLAELMELADGVGLDRATFGNISAPNAVLQKIDPGYAENKLALPTTQEISLRKELMNEIDKLSRQRADVCNRMHDVPKEVPCPELMADALAIAEQVEDAWTKYRYLEKNGHLPEDVVEETKERSLELLLAMDKRKKIAEKISKLKPKINTPINKNHKKLQDWKDELEMAILERNQLDDNITILKNR